MKMASAGGGFGMGVKDYVVVFVFDNDQALAHFLDSGWSGSGQADAAAKAGDKGGAYSGSKRGCPGSMGLPVDQEWPCTSVDSAGYEVLQGRRPQQVVAPVCQIGNHEFSCAVSQHRVSS